MDDSKKGLNVMTLQKLGAEKNSFDYWENTTDNYVDVLEGDYHTHRLGVIDALIPEELYQPGKRIFDFGCGNAVHYPQFTDKGAEIEGVDISEAMVAEAHENLNKWNMPLDTVKLGGVELMKTIPDNSFDAVISFNVLAYLTNDEDREFYIQAQRILKTGGQLIVTHSNSLFDMYSLNAMTAQFFSDNYNVMNTGELLVNNQIDPDRPQYNVRENPLAYRHKLSHYGLEEEQQEFINFHPVPPMQMPANRDYADTLNVAEDQRWKLMFQCSTYGSRSVKK